MCFHANKRPVGLGIKLSHYAPAIQLKNAMIFMFGLLNLRDLKVNNMVENVSCTKDGGSNDDHPSQVCFKSLC